MKNEISLVKIIGESDELDILRAIALNTILRPCKMLVRNFDVKSQVFSGFYFSKEKLYPIQSKILVQVTPGASKMRAHL